MADDKKSIRVICQGGLDATQNYLNLSANKPGCATRLVNYEVGLGGGYRRMNGYLDYDADFPVVDPVDAQGKILGIMIFENSATGNVDIIAARRNITDPTIYKLYKYEFGTGWIEIVTGLTLHYNDGGAQVDKIRYDVANDGDTNVLAFADGVNKATIFDGTTWASLSSSGTGADMSNAGGPNAITAPTLVCFFSGSLMMAADTINNQTGIIGYSAPNKFFDFTDASGGGQMVAGAEVIDMKPFRDSMYVFGSNRIKKAVADTTAGFLMKDITTNMGAVTRDSIVEIGGDLVFLGPDGFRPVSGTDKIGDVQLETLSKPIHNLIKNRLEGNSGLPVNSVVIRSKSQFRIFFGDDEHTQVESKGIVGALRTADQVNGWEFGEILGFRASCATSHYINGEEIVLHGDYDGHVYREETGNSLNGADMVSIYSTPYLDFGDTEIRKVFEKVNLFVQGEGDIGLALTVEYDWGKADIATPAAYNIELAGVHPIYDGGFLYDDPGSVYGGVLTPIAVENIEGSFFSTRLTFTGSGTESSHSIHAMVLEFAAKGRR